MRIPLFLAFWLLCVVPAFAQNVALDRAKLTAETSPEGSSFTITGNLRPDGKGVLPLIATTRINSTAKVSLAGSEITATVETQVLQGELETLSLRLSTAAEVVSVSGDGVLDFGVRQTPAGERFLDLRTTPPRAERKNLKATIVLRQTWGKLPATWEAPLLAPDKAGLGESTASFSFVNEITPAVAEAKDVFQGASADKAVFNFRLTGPGSLRFSLARSDASFGIVSLTEAKITGNLRDGFAAWELAAKAQVRRTGQPWPFLDGRAALASAPTGASARLSAEGATSLVFPTAGDTVLAAQIHTRVDEVEGWSELRFTLPSGQVMGLSITGLPDSVQFHPESVPPLRQNAESFVVDKIPLPGWTGFVPGDGQIRLRWRSAPPADSASFVFQVESRSEAQLSAGLLRQVIEAGLSVLQGESSALTLQIAGEGEILRVTSDKLIDWSVSDASPAAGERRRELKLRWSRPVSKTSVIRVETQTALGALPAQVSLLRLEAPGAVRTGGHLLVAPDGPVRLDVSTLSGLVQLPPEDWPLAKGDAAKVPARALVYRHHGGSWILPLTVSEIRPDISVNSVVIHELADNATTLTAESELEIREAPLRELTILGPSSYTLSSATGVEGLETVAGPDENGRRRWRLVFPKPVFGRALLVLRWERDGPPAAGEWTAPALGFPGAKTVRGHVGIVASASWRLSVSQATDLTEVAPAYFPKKMDGLALAFRLRSPEASPVLKVERAEQTVTADVLHLHALSEGADHVSFLVNYRVVGAPLGQVLLRLPKNAANVEFTGLDIRSWKVVGEDHEVLLHRPLSGTGTLLATFELPLGGSNLILEPRAARPLNVSSEQGFVLVTGEHFFRLAPEEAKNLHAVAEEEIPAEYRPLLVKPLLSAHQYGGADASLRLKVERLNHGDTVAQLVDFADVGTRLSVRGEVLTVARYALKSRGQARLRLTLPKGATLQDIQVEGRPVLPAQEGDALILALPAAPDPNTPLTVIVRCSQVVSGSNFPLSAPSLSAPVVQTRWQINAEEGRILRVEGGNLSSQPGVTMGRRGFWDRLAVVLERDPVRVAVVFGIGVIAFLTALLGLRYRRQHRAKLGWAFGLLSVVTWVGLGVASWAIAREAARLYLPGPVESSVLILETTSQPAGFAPLVELSHITVLFAKLSVMNIALLVLGGVLVLKGALSSGGFPLLQRALGWGLVAAVLGTKAYDRSAVLTLGFAFLFEVLVPLIRAWRQPLPPAPPEPPAETSGPSAPVAAAATLLALASFLGMPNDASAKEVAPPQSVSGTNQTSAALLSVKQEITVSAGQARASGRLEVQGVAGDRLPWLDAPATVTAFKAVSGAVRLLRDASGRHTLVFETDGPAAVEFSYETPVASDGLGFVLPTLPSAADSATVTLEQDNQELRRAAALAVASQGTAGRTFTVTLGPRGDRRVTWRPKPRDPATETLSLFVESRLALRLSAGAAEARQLWTLKPAQGQVSEFSAVVPAGWSISDVGGEAVSNWRFDPASRKLSIRLSPPQRAPFTVSAGLQSPLPSLPGEITLQPLLVEGAAGISGQVGVSTSPEVQLVDAVPDKLTGVSLEDFDPRAANADPNAQTPALRRAYRHGPTGGSLTLKLAAVEPELRVVSSQTLSLGEDRSLLAADLTCNILRAGLFRVSFVLPEGWDLEAASGSHLSHHGELKEGDARIVTLHFNGRVLGATKLRVQLSGPGSGKVTELPAPRISLREASRASGDLRVVPEAGLRVTVAKRAQVSPLDPASLGVSAKGALAFKLLQSDWELTLGFEPVTPWVQTQWLQEVTLREGQARWILNVDASVDNAGIKSLTVNLPKELEGVRAVGDLVADATQTPGSPGTWVVRFSRRVLGRAQFQIQAALPMPAAGGALALTGPVFPEASQSRGHLALRAAGLYEVSAAPEAASLVPAEWPGLSEKLRLGLETAAPTYCLRVVGTTFALNATLSRHEAAKLPPARVRSAQIMTALGRDGAALTLVNWELDLRARQTLRVKLPAGAVFWGAWSNNQSAAPAREGDSWLIAVAPSPLADQPAVLEILYAQPNTNGSRVKLQAPYLDAPQDHITWDVRLPSGLVMRKWDGALDRVPDPVARPQSVQAESSWTGYLSKTSSRQQAMEQQAKQFYALGNELWGAGDQQQARVLLDNARNYASQDAAFNEDARVQYNNIVVDQALNGIARRRNYANPQGANPAAMAQQGAQQEDVNRLTKSALKEANAKLSDDNDRRVAEKLVARQEAAATPHTALRPELPQGGGHIRFQRSLQVGGSAPLELNLELAEAPSAPSRNPLVIASLLAALGLALAGWIARKPLKA